MGGPAVSRPSPGVTPGVTVPSGGAKGVEAPKTPEDDAVWAAADTVVCSKRGGGPSGAGPIVGAGPTVAGATGSDGGGTDAPGADPTMPPDDSPRARQGLAVTDGSVGSMAEDLGGAESAGPPHIEETWLERVMQEPRQPVGLCGGPPSEPRSSWIPDTGPALPGRGGICAIVYGGREHRPCCLVGGLPVRCAPASCGGGGVATSGSSVGPEGAGERTCAKRGAAGKAAVELTD